ncbi:MAG: hypothetical protein D6763_12260, partial [Alphaproteobacteria bacterium]
PLGRAEQFTDIENALITSGKEGLDTLRTGKGCETVWRYEENRYIRVAASGSCSQHGEQEGKAVYWESLLTPSEIHLTPSRDSLKAGPEDDPEALRLRKVRPFECWTAVLRGARHGDSGEGLNDWDFRRGGWIHDQGGVLALNTDEDPPRQIRLRLRRVEWPSGSRRPSLTLYVEEGASRRAVSYAWTEYDAERIGLNLRWIQASCSHAPDRLLDE